MVLDQGMKVLPKELAALLSLSQMELQAWWEEAAPEGLISTTSVPPRATLPLLRLRLAVA